MALVLITPAAQAQFDGLPKPVRVRMERIFVRLEDCPQPDIVVIEKVGHRDGFYGD